MNTPPSNTFQLHLSEPGTNRPDNSVLTPYALEKGDQDDSHPVVFRRRVVTVNMDSDSVSTIQMREMMRQFIEGSRKVLLDKLFWGSPTDPSVLDQITHSYGGSEISRFEVTDSVVDGDLYKTLWAEFTIKDHGSTHHVIQAVLSGIPFKLELYPVELTIAVEDPCHSTQIHRYRSLDHYVVLADFDHLPVSEDTVTPAVRQMAGGNFEPFFDLISAALKQLSNRDYQKFDEKYVKLLIIAYAVQSEIFFVQSERETTAGGYIDLELSIQPKNLHRPHFQYVFEIKYLKKENEHLLTEKQEEAENQLNNYLASDTILKNAAKLRAFSLVVVKDEMFLKEIL